MTRSYEYALRREGRWEGGGGEDKVGQWCHLIRQGSANLPGSPPGLPFPGPGPDEAWVGGGSGGVAGAEQVGQRRWGSGVICFAKTRLVSLDLQQALSPKDQVAKQYLVLVVGLPPSDSFVVAKQYLVLVLGLPPSDPFVVDAPIARDPDHEFDFLCVFDSPCPSQVAKQYLVLVVGLPRLDSFTVDAPIARDPDHEFARMVVGEDIVEMRGDGVADEHMERKGEETGKEGTEGGKEGVGESVEESGAQKKEECGSGTPKKESKIQEARTEFSVLARSEASGAQGQSQFLSLSPPRLASLPSPLPPCRLFIYPSGYPFYKPSQ
ncbi:unnamed protein product [Closterium sp. NIES-65]|nr:unnamed protein product [Closterium sp. NIES-65]